MLALTARPDIISFAGGLPAPEAFPVDVNRVDYEQLLRVPGIGVKSAKMIIVSRRFVPLTSEQLKKIGVVMKKARYFITCRELPFQTIHELSPLSVRKLLTAKKRDDGRQLTIPFGE